MTPTMPNTPITPITQSPQNTQPPRHHEHDDTLFPENPPAPTTSHKNETTNHNNTPPAPATPHPHTTTKKHQNTRRTQKCTKKMADFRHFFNNKTPITPTFAPCFWLFLRDYLQFLKISSNVHRPVLRYFLYLFPVHFHYSGRPLSVLFLNNN